METIIPRIVYCCGEISHFAKGTVAIHASDPEETLAVVESGDVELCVLFAIEKDTESLCRQIRKVPRGALLPLVIVGGLETAVANLAKALEIGADAFLDKEDLDMLPEKIETLLGLEVDGSLPSRSSSIPIGMTPVDDELMVSLDPVEDALSIMRRQASELSGFNSDIPSLSEEYTGSLNDLVKSVDDHLEGALEQEAKEVNLQSAEYFDAPEVDVYVNHPDAVEDDVLEEIKNLNSAENIQMDVASTEPGILQTSNEDLQQRIKSYRLEETALWEILAFLLSKRSSGVLVLESRGIVRKVIFEDGDPVMASSNAKDDRLADLLYREGRLSEEQYDLASMTVGASGRRVGAILVEKGFIASKELFPLVRHHYEMLIIDSFSWREGTCHFEEGEFTLTERILLDLPSAGLIVEGIKSRVDSADLDRAVPRGSRLLKLDEGICPLESTGLTPSELEILDWCDGDRTVDDLAIRFSLHSFEIRILAMGLSVLGWLRVDGAAALQKNVLLRSDNSKSQTSQQDAQIERGRIKNKLLQIEDGNYFSIIETTPLASGHEVKKSYQRMKGVFTFERLASLDLGDLQADVEVIRSVLEETYEILGDPVLRDAYRQAQSKES